jgi:hypothetical protein
VNLIYILRPPVACQPQGFHASFPMSQSGVSLGSIGAVAVLINFAPAFKNSRQGFITSYQTITNSSVTELQRDSFACAGICTAFFNQMVPIISYFCDSTNAQLPSNIPLFAVYLVVSCSIGAQIGAFLAPVLMRPFHILLGAVWHPCCGLPVAEDFKAFLTWTGKRLHQKET